MLGDYNSWIWPWNTSGITSSEADAYLSSKGYTAHAFSQTGVTNVKIIAYGTSSNNITHFSRLADASVSNYTNAKWGTLERLQSIGLDPYKTK